MADDIYLQMQKLNNQTQLKLQNMTDKSTAQTFKFNSKEAKKSRDWQEMMSNTSHQREVKDLKKAGLNPVLSVNQGAASYTTSSASGEADNAASAVGNLYASQISGMAGVKQSEISAAATRHAAATTAAAQKAAAAQAAAAQRYAADMNYRTQQMKSEWEYKKQKYASDKAYQAVIDKPVTSIGGFLDKLATKSGLYSVLGTNTIKGLIYSANKLLNDPKAFFLDAGKYIIDKTNFKLNSNGISLVDKNLFSMGLQPNQYTRNLYVKGLVFQDNSSANALVNIVKSNRERFSRGTGRRMERMYW